MTNDDSEGRQALARYVREARLKKFKTVDAARIAAGVARGTWEAVERGDVVRDYTLSKIDEVFDWPIGRCEKIIRTKGAVQPLDIHPADSDSRVELTFGGVEIVLLDKYGEQAPFDDQVRFVELVRSKVRTGHETLSSLVQQALRDRAQQDTGRDLRFVLDEVPEILRRTPDGRTAEEAWEAERQMLLQQLSELRSEVVAARAEVEEQRSEGR